MAYLRITLHKGTRKMRTLVDHAFKYHNNSIRHLDEATEIYILSCYNRNEHYNETFHPLHVFALSRNQELSNCNTPV